MFAAQLSGESTLRSVRALQDWPLLLSFHIAHQMSASLGEAYSTDQVSKSHTGP